MATLSFRENGPARFNPLWSIFDEIPGGTNEWQEEHTRVVAKMAMNRELNMLAVGAIDYIDSRLQRDNQAFWFLYDDLNEDLLEKDGLRNEALAGLFRLVRMTSRFISIRFKIFLREDIWKRLDFDAKSDFNGRNIILQWTREDF